MSKIINLKSTEMNPMIKSVETEESCLSSLSTDGRFKYGGYHFIPFRKLNSTEKKEGLKDFSKRLISSNIKLNKYNYLDFYKSSGDSEADIFKCLEDGKFYIPSDNQLFGFKNI